MLWRKATIGLGVGCVALAVAGALVPGKSMADDARHAVSFADYRVTESSPSGAKIQLVRHHGYGGGGWGWGGGYRGYRGYGYGGYYRPYYARPYYGAYYGVGPSYGYGYGAGYSGYGYGGYGGGRCW